MPIRISPTNSIKAILGYWLKCTCWCQSRVKSITAREIFHRVPAVKKQLWGGEFWSKGSFISTVGRHGNEEVIRHYVKKQGQDKTYKQLHRQDVQLELF